MEMQIHIFVINVIQIVLNAQDLTILIVFLVQIINFYNKILV